MKKRDITILVIEDDVTMRDGIRTVLEKEGHQVFVTGDGYEGSRLFREHGPEIVVSDLRLPGKSGMELLREFLERHPAPEILMISAYGTVDIAVNALKLGARDFIAKPFTIDELRSKVNQIVESMTATEALPAEGETGETFHGMIGSSEAALELFRKVKEVAEVESPVLISGESGTGKELIARAIHKESQRAGQPFLAVNCGALSETLLESELFGHEQGAFTGAVNRHIGVFEQADNGTILLDEIGEISPAMQVKLLRVLQYQTFQRVGGTQEITTDVRVIAATNRELKQAVREDRFREDLYYRVNVLPIHVPPLRHRQEDIPELVKHISRRKAKTHGKPVPTWRGDAMEKIRNYSWPGNIRELENFLERLLIFHPKEEIAADDIYFDEMATPEDSPKGSLNEVLEQTEYRMIVEALQQSGGVKQRAARQLGINTSTLYYKMEKYGIRRGDEE